MLHKRCGLKMVCVYDDAVEFVLLGDENVVVNLYKDKYSNTYYRENDASRELEVLGAYDNDEDAIKAFYTCMASFADEYFDGQIKFGRRN